MLELFTKYTVESVIIFLFLVLTALREGISLWEFFKNKGTDILSKDLVNQDRIDKNQHDQLQIENALEKITEKVDVLLQSDKDAIKSWIVMIYRKVKVDPKHLNDIEMDLLERRYSHYLDEGGNSYVTHLMEQLRQIYNNKEDE